MAGTIPLQPGTILNSRFELTGTLGRGGFGITYTANDLALHQPSVVKELAPIGSIRQGNSLDLSAVPSTNPQRLIKRFLDEAKLIGGIDAPGVLKLRDAFAENGTAYYATEHVEGARTLESVLAQEGRMTSEGVQDILFQLLDTVEAVHQHRILHRDIKPSNILVDPDGRVYLIDFGAAREWHADSAVLHTVLFTPGYAPIEQLSDHGKRGPATDIYALCATAYHMLAGFPPRSAAERADGTDMIPLSRLRPDVDQPMLTALTEGLELRFKDRPQSIAELREMMMTQPEPHESEGDTIARLDAIAVRLERFSYSKRECPACGSLLDEPKALKTGLCPICHQRAIHARNLSERLCGSCHTGILQPAGDKLPLIYCPQCKRAPMDFRRQGLLRKTLTAECPDCGFVLTGDAESATGVADHGSPITDHRKWPEWLAISGRSAVGWICDLCHTQYDVLPNGRWREFKKKGLTGREFFPQEWARIAAGLQPDAGNATCNACKADFWLDSSPSPARSGGEGGRGERSSAEGGCLTVLRYDEDPFGYGKTYLGKAIPLDDLPWKAAGKASGHAGLVCHRCQTEFDTEGQFLQLASSPNQRLMKHAGRSLVMEDWHRIAQGLPEVAEEEAFFDSINSALVAEYEAGTLPLDDKNEALLWEGAAKEVRVEDEEIIELSDGALTITSEEVSYGRLFRKWRVPLTSVRRVEGQEDLLWLHISGEEEPRTFELAPHEITVSLSSGERKVVLTAESLAALLSRQLRDAATEYSAS